MTYLTRFQPLSDFVSLQREMSRLFQDFGRGSEELLTSGTFVPAADIYEDEHNITIKLEVPGIEEKDLDIRVENNTLSLTQQRNVRGPVEGRATTKLVRVE